MSEWPSGRFHECRALGLERSVQAWAPVTGDVAADRVAPHLSHDSLDGAENLFDLVLEEQHLHVAMQRRREGELVEHTRSRSSRHVDHHLIAAQLRLAAWQGDGAAHGDGRRERGGRTEAPWRGGCEQLWRSGSHSLASVPLEHHFGDCKPIEHLLLGTWYLASGCAQV